MPGPDWNLLRRTHPKELVDALRSRFERGDGFELDGQELASSTHHPAQAGSELLEELYSQGFLGKRQRFICPCERQEGLAPSEGQLPVCPRCNQAFKDVGKVRCIEIYPRIGTRSRDVRWMLALHGMNTLGAWQEDFNWLISRTYGYSVPVAIYKYGVIRPGVLIRYRQRELTQELIGRIQRLSKQTDAVGFGGIPDVIAHSFGTWLLGHALQEDRRLKVGRVILTGSILRPDFDWAEMIRRGQAEAVLCHYGTKDIWARLTHYIIPDSGPSGCRGFDDSRTVVNVVAPGFEHSDFFLPGRMPSVHARVWKPFLTKPGEELMELATRSRTPQVWRQSCWPLRATLLRYSVLLLLVVLAVLAAVVMVLGTCPTIQVLKRLPWKWLWAIPRRLVGW